MSIDLGDSQYPLIHVHVCSACGNTSHREEFDDGAQAKGIYSCSKCGKEGPLNIEIRHVDMLVNDSGTAG